MDIPKNIHLRMAFLSFWKPILFTGNNSKALRLTDIGLLSKTRIQTCLFCPFMILENCEKLWNGPKKSLGIFNEKLGIA